MRISFVVVLALLLSFSACKEKQNSTSAKKEPVADTTGQVVDTTSGETYFSIRAFFDDQWTTRKGMPYTLLRVEKNDGRTDSAFADLDSLLWQELRGPFDRADISDKKFAGLYNFEMFDDEATQTSNLNFDAKKPELYMQKMYITVDQFSRRVQSVYIETRATGEGYTHSQKLNYIPDRIIQIQDFETPAGAPARHRTVEYRYKY
ncbi:hypothetical protein [Taibaiella chishuiensis]|uniref:Uncharacterized protein n=1 Tax=Taibaiella chishuiensis TaxID=1434707 RepID=A0A2P8D4L3_9BACT|nr:hypothetical protein [Taibaiella chishuiensis]PSK92164.1 hypothetical protein B0I18_104262 [Taibaiella chishuiensis]